MRWNAQQGDLEGVFVSTNGFGLGLYGLVAVADLLLSRKYESR